MNEKKDCSCNKLVENNSTHDNVSAHNPMNAVQHMINAEANQETSNQLTVIENLFELTAPTMKLASTHQKDALNEVKEFDVNELMVEDLIKNNYLSISLKLPSGQKVLLKQIKLTTNNFIVDSELTSPQQYDTGTHYHGVVDGTDETVALSFYKNGEMIGSANLKTGSLTIGKLPASTTNKHLSYKESFTKQMKTCFTKDSNKPYTTGQLRASAPADATGKCVKIYFEADYDLYQNKGSIPNVVSYVTALFNQSAILYANEGITMKISEIFVWDRPSPYTSSDTGELLDQFGAYRTSFNGDLAHLLVLRGGGGIAWVGGLCQQQRRYSMAVSGISPTFSNVPTYSWSVYVITHEMGHLMGSQHTHACVWNGNNTAIDGCAGFTEGGCPLPGNPAGGGTIMSYCHLTNVGVNFSLGFGPQPGNIIRNSYNAAQCLQSCDPSIITVNPTTLTFNAANTNPANQTLTLTNTSANSLNWMATDNVPWLTISPTSGVVQANQSIVLTAQCSIAGMANGKYNAAISIQTSSATLTVPVTLNIARTGPTINVNPTSIIIATNTNPPPAQTIQISNLGPGVLSWSATDNAAWMSLSSIPAGLSVTFNNLQSGVNNGSITITSNAINGTVIIPVTITINTPPPVIQVTPTSLNFSSTNGAIPATQNVAIANIGPGILNWTATKNSAWISLSAANGTAPSSLGVSINPKELKAGNYVSNIIISAPGAASKTIIVNISVIRTGPNLMICPNTLTFTTTVNTNPPVQSIAVTNSGSGIVAWTAGENSNWLSLAATATRLNASVNVAGMTAGTYTAVVTIYSNGAANTPITVPITLVIT